jgi:hypothetical protein
MIAGGDMFRLEKRSFLGTKPNKFRPNKFIKSLIF